MKKHIVCFGDSNTHGYDGDSLGRFDELHRWTKLLQMNLGNDCLVIEEGLSGRTTCFDDPLTEGLSGLSLITPCLMSHEPVDLLVIMLGTNDTKERFNVSTYEIGKAMTRLIQKAKNTNCWANNPKILLVTPKNIDDEYENSWIFPEMGKGCAEKSRGLSKVYEQVANDENIYYFDANSVVSNNNHNDYMHIDELGHKQLADGLANKIKEVL